MLSKNFYEHNSRHVDQLRQYCRMESLDINLIRLEILNTGKGRSRNLAKFISSTVTRISDSFRKDDPAEKDQRPNIMSSA